MFFRDFFPRYFSATKLNRSFGYLIYNCHIYFADSDYHEFPSMVKVHLLLSQILLILMTMGPINGQQFITKMTWTGPSSGGAGAGQVREHRDPHPFGGTEPTNMEVSIVIGVPQNGLSWKKARLNGRIPSGKPTSPT